MSDSSICPDCKHPVETHAMFKSGRCPVVRLDSLAVTLPNYVRIVYGYVPKWAKP